MSNALFILHWQQNVTYGVTNIISRPLSKQTAYEQSKRGKSSLSPPALKLLRIPTRKCHLSANTDEKSYSVWKHTFNLSSEITKLLPKDNKGYISVSGLQGRPCPPFQHYPFKCRHFLHLLQRCITQLRYACDLLVTAMTAFPSVPADRRWIHLSPIIGPIPDPAQQPSTAGQM